jgi:EAL domain-containing protein (putative c-di-GMP-specific phosphodiesterase class I)
VELTESAALDSAASVEVLHRLHRASVRLALDDFGTGYASLAQIGRIPFAVVKIDRSFAAKLGSGDPNVHRRMSAIASLIHSFEMSVVAEGIETEAQLAAARAAGCDLMQGFFLGRPTPLRAAAEAEPATA